MSHPINNIENLYRAGISIAFAVRSFDLSTRLILWIEERDSDQKVLLAERIIPTGMMARYQVTLAQSQSQSEKRVSIFDVRHTLKISIALLIQSLDLRWSENHFTKEHLLKDCHRSKDERYLLKELFRQG